jgi:hypothetical protein
MPGGQTRTGLDVSLGIDPIKVSRLGLRFFFSQHHPRLRLTLLQGQTLCGGGRFRCRRRSFELRVDPGPDLAYQKSNRDRD